MAQTDHDYARQSAERSLGHIMALMRRYHAAEQLSEEEEEIHTEIRETPLLVHVPGEPSGPNEPNAEPSEADDFDSVIIDLSGPNDPYVRVLLAATGDTELQYAYWGIPWTTLPLPSQQQQRYLDDFGAQFAWMRETFGTPAEPVLACGHTSGRRRAR